MEANQDGNTLQGSFLILQGSFLISYSWVIDEGIQQSQVQNDQSCFVTLCNIDRGGMGLGADPFIPMTS